VSAFGKEKKSTAFSKNLVAFWPKNSLVNWNFGTFRFMFCLGFPVIPTFEAGVPAGSPSTVATDEAEEPQLWDLIVKGTFLNLDDGQSLMKRYRKIRKAKTDFALEVAMKDPEVYELGKLCKSDEVAKQAQPTATDAGRDDDKENHQAKIGSKEKTTVMLRNLPNNYTREMFLQMLDENGLKGQYDFVYLPCDFYHDANLGYAFVNMVDASAVFLAWKAFQGFSDWSLPSAKVCQVMWSGPHQGFEAHVERYRNSPLMHQNVPDVFKPMIFRNGKRQPFPKPTKCLQAPFPF